MVIGKNNCTYPNCKGLEYYRNHKLCYEHYQKLKDKNRKRNEK